MESVINPEIINQVLQYRMTATKEYQKCSYLTPDGKYLPITEHYEVHKLLVVEDLVACPSDAEQLLSELGYIRYSWIGYVTLANKEPTKEQYVELEKILDKISVLRYEVCLQIQNNPKFYSNYSLENIPAIIEDIKRYYSTGILPEIH